MEKGGIGEVLPSLLGVFYEQHGFQCRDVELIHNQDDGLVYVCCNPELCRAIGNWFAPKLVRETDHLAALSESACGRLLGFDWVLPGC